MKQRYRMFRRENEICYSLDTVGNKRNSLNTTNRAVSRRTEQRPARNETHSRIYRKGTRSFRNRSLQKQYEKFRYTLSHSLKNPSQQQRKAAFNRVKVGKLGKYFPPSRL